MSTEIINLIVSIVAKAIIIGLTVLVVRVVLPWLKDTGLYAIVTRFVQAAEKLGSTGKLANGAAKKQYVIELLEARGITVTDSTEALIESAVEELDCAVGDILLPAIGEAVNSEAEETNTSEAADEN